MKLFEPGKIGRLSLINRIVMAPMGLGGLTEPDGRLSQQSIDYYVARAKGGVGLIVTANFRAHRWLEQPPNLPLVRHVMVDNRMYISRLNQLADYVHDYGAKVAVQLTAGVGRVATVEVLNEGMVATPSPLPFYHDPSVMTREMTIEEIRRLVRDFEHGAKILSAAGIDGVELHGHEGYLFDQFLTSLWNKRTDKYGGDLEGRLRFSVEIIEAIKKGAGSDFPVIYRFGLTHYLEGGREIEEGLEIARRLEAAGVDAFDIDAGSYETWHWAHPPTYQAPGCMVNLAEMVKKVVSVPVIAVGKLGYPVLAEKVLQEGKADFIALGRALLADPEWPVKVKTGRLEDIRPCVGDHECLKRVLGRKYISCTVNPVTGMERDFAITPADNKKSVLVVGGGPGGMEAARVAALRGHEVTLWEKSDTLGGNLIPASVPDFKQDYRDLINYLSNQVKKLNINIEFGKEATLGLVQEMRPDVVIVATGSTPIIPEIPGIEKGNVANAIDLLMAKKEAGDSVVVLGGGLIGCETALYLAQKGKRLTIVEISDAVARDSYTANRMNLLKLLAEAGVTILTDRTTSQITDDGVIMIDKNGRKERLQADTVALALGLRSNRKLLEELEDKVPDVHAIGDCVQPRQLISAIWEGFRSARLV